MTLSLHNKYALITGAGRGLGLEMAIAMGEAGLNGVTITAAPGSDETSIEIENELRAAISVIEETGITVNAVFSDVGRADDCKQAIDSHMKAFPSLDILINNAGKAGRYAHKGETDKDISGHDPAGMAEIIETNLCGPYFMLHHALPHMRKLTRARVINISKRTESMHRKAWTPYGPTKAALEAATIAWAESLSETGVTVNTLSPGGAVNTKFGTGEISGNGIDPRTIRPMTVWLASDASDEFNGCRFVADRWDSALPDIEAALGCQESQIFPRPERNTPLKKAWI
jgi:NAD(P)-dependent dehydrogenase (short-subunit alcohol dehydrogenase family)